MLQESLLAEDYKAIPLEGENLEDQNHQSRSAQESNLQKPFFVRIAKSYLRLKRPFQSMRS